MSRSRALRSWLLLAVTILLGLAAIGAGASILVTAILRSRALAAEESIRLVVDLSRPGTYEGKFQQASIPAHGQQFRLIVDPPFTSEEEARKALTGLRGSLEIRKADGTLCSKQAFKLGLVNFLIKGPKPKWSDRITNWGNHCQGSAELPPFTPYLSDDTSDAGLDPCDFTLVVSNAPAGMKGRSQMIVGKTVWCSTQSEIPKWLGGLLMAAGLIFLLPACRAVWRLIRLRGAAGF